MRDINLKHFLTLKTLKFFNNNFKNPVILTNGDMSLHLLLYLINIKQHPEIF